jgi:haloacetate dehalogenase
VFDGFTLERVDVGEATLRVRHGGTGPAVLLLHGHPRTHATWHRVAPLLARSHTVVCPDLRGYGESSKPPTTPGHEPYAKRAMAADCLALMGASGTGASPWSATTAARTWPCGPRSTTPGR